MGNTSCTLSIISTGATKVLLPNGKLETHPRPTKAANVMLQNPGQFVCNATDLKVGHRIPGLLPDQELERHQLYFLLPMDLLYSVLTHEEKSFLTYKATKALKQARFLNVGKIFFPVLMSEFCSFSSQVKRFDNMGIQSEQQPLIRRYSKQRSWKPALQTIVETSCI